MPAANTYSSPSTAGGNREDLRSILTILDPEKTPVVSAAPKVDAPKATFVEWMIDDLRDPRITGVPEGQDVTTFNNQMTNLDRLGNYIQVDRDEFQVTDVQQLVTNAAYADMYAASKAKAVRQVKRDMEAAVCSNNDRTSITASTAGKSRGFFQWIVASGTNSDVPAYASPSSSAPAAIYTGESVMTETIMATILQSIYVGTGMVQDLMCVAGSDVVSEIDLFSRTTGGVAESGSTYTGRYRVNDSAESRTINLSVQRFRSSFGTVHIVPDLLMFPAGSNVQTSALYLNRELYALSILDPLHSVDLEDQGGGPRGYVKCMWTLVCKNPKGFGKFTA